jgi:hypothetical protein
MESVPANLEKAIRSINEAMVDAREELSGQPRGITKG